MSPSTRIESCARRRQYEERQERAAKQQSRTADKTEIHAEDLRRLIHGRHAPGGGDDRDYAGVRKSDEEIQRETGQPRWLTDSPGKSGSPDQQQQPASAASAIGGLFGRMKQRRQGDYAGPQRSELFESNSELLKASATASADDVALPAGFREKYIAARLSRARSNRSRS